MNALKPKQWIALVLGIAMAMYLVYSHLQYFGNVSFLGAVVVLEIIIASLWSYDQRFFALLIVAFAWAGMNVPLEGAWTGGRWAVLAAGTVVGLIIWLKAPRSPFGSIHLVAFFCISAAFVSATVSTYTQMSSFKALSLLLLFTYCMTGGRLAVLGREERFFNGLLLACEIIVYVTAVCYVGLRASIWGNPNSLGAAMSIGLFPVLLWGWLTSDGPVVRTRRLVALLLCTYLVFLSMARAGMISISLVTLIFCICLHQYKLLTRLVALLLLMIAIVGMVAPDTLKNTIGPMTDAVLYKGHKGEGLLGSRRTPWEKSIATIKEHPYFGTGYGTSPTGEDPGFGFGRFSSSAETAREHGNSYMTITEWTGLLGVLPFAAIVALTLKNIWKGCAWMNRTSDPRNYAIPVVMIVLSGLVHASFEDWLFAVGSYTSVYFWFFAFVLADLLPRADDALFAGVRPRTSQFMRTRYEAGFPGHVLPNR